MRLDRTILATAAAMVLLGACAAQPAAAPAGSPASAAQSILQSSTPADGSTVAAPVNALVLRFSPPARLAEVTVTGSDGQAMPMMVTPVGEVESYTIPLPGLGPGNYAVHWRASAAGTAYSGSFGFTVR